MTDRRQTGREPDASAEDPVESEMLAELLETPVDRGVPASPGAPCIVAECVEDRHPTLQGRVCVRVREPDGLERQWWAPTLQGLAVRTADRVLMIRPGNSTEWIVTGVVDGFTRRPQPEKGAAATLELKCDQSVQVVAQDGQPLVEVSQGAAGPQIRILQPDVEVAFAGRLVIKAEDIQLEATQGQVAIRASKDVIVKGEVVQLN